MNVVRTARRAEGREAGALRSFALLEAGLNLIEQGITIFDRDLRLVHANRRFVELYDLPEDFLVPGTTFEAIIRFVAEMGDFGPGETGELVRERVERAQRFEDHYLERTRPNGKVIAVEGHALADGGWVAVYTDITAGKHQEAMLREKADRLSLGLVERSEQLGAANRELAAANRALEEARRQLVRSEARMRAITRSVPAHIAYVDRDRVYRFTNDRFPDIFGHRDGAVTGRKVDELFEPAVMEVLLPAIEAALEGAHNSVEFAPVGHDGLQRHVRTSLAPDQLPGGEIVGIYVLSLDITEEKRAMDALVRTKRLEAATQLTSGVVHDFSNILTIIQGNLSRLSEDGLSAQERDRIVQVTRRAVERGGRVTDQLMSFSRNEELSPAPSDVGRIAEELVRLFSASLDPAISVAIEAGQDAAGAFVDERAFQDALLNLLLNARDAVGQAGAIRVSIGLREGDGRARVAVAVSDDGCGFAAGTIEHACRAFFSTKQGGRGRGLGLSMVRRFVRRSDGELVIESEPGRGATVTMLLPPAEIEAASGQARTADGAGDAFGGLALVIDDEPDIRGLVRQHLIESGAKVIEAAGPDEALELVRQVPLIALVVSDIAMAGGRTGIELCREIRRLRPGIPVLVMSGLAAGHPALDAAQAEFSLLRKPFGPAEIGAALDALWADRRAGAP